MRYSAGALSRIRTLVVALFVLFGILFFSVLWVKSGGNIPLVTGHGYKVNAQFPNIANLSHASDVEMAGVPIGTVETLNTEPGTVKVGMVLHRNAPLHQGATVQIQDKTLIGEGFVLLTDGHGKALRSGATLPLTATQNYTSVNDVFNAIKPADQTAAKQLLTEFNSATTGQGKNVNNLLADLANVGAQGQTVFDILANQTNDLQQLVHQTGTLLAVLDEGQGQIGDLATSAEAVSQATANSQAALASSVQKLPGVITSARNASGSIETLSAALSPVARNLQAAAPTLNQALTVLPPTTRSLRSILNPLNGSLVQAPATLGPLPTSAGDLTTLAKPAANLLSNLNPIVNYVAPYKRDTAAFFSNFNAAADSHVDATSFYAVVELLTNGSKGLLPLPTNFENTLGSDPNFNPIPLPGQSATNPTAPAPAQYPVVKRLKY